MIPERVPSTMSLADWHRLRAAVSTLEGLLNQLGTSPRHFGPAFAAMHNAVMDMADVFEVLHPDAQPLPVERDVLNPRFRT